MNQPENYSNNNWLQTREATRLLDKYLSPETWKRGKSILEIGMGDGRYTFEVFQQRLPDNIQRYVASDISKEMVEFARQKYSKKKYLKTEFQILDCQTENLPTDLIEQFDYVVSFNCFHWFTNTRKAFENIIKMLKPGGEVIATFFNENPLDDIFCNLSNHPKWGVYGHGEYVSNFFNSKNCEKNWIDTVRETGFENIKNFHEVKTVEFFDKFEEFFHSLDPISVKIPENEKVSYLRDYIQAIKKGKGFTITEDEDTGKTRILLSIDVMFLRASKPLN